MRRLRHSLPLLLAAACLALALPQAAGASPDEAPAIGHVTLFGAPEVGATLAADVAYEPASASVTYRWFRGTSMIAGATGTSYRLTAADAGADIVLKVTVTSGTQPAAVQYSNHVQVGGVPMPRVVEVELLGDIKVGSPVTAHTTHTSGVTLTYQWFRDGSLIAGATGGVFTPTPAEAGKDLVAKVTATYYGLVSAPKYSNHATVDGIWATPIVVADYDQPGLISARFTISLHTTTKYEWFADGKFVVGARIGSLRLDPAWHDIVLKVTLTRDGFEPVIKYSNHWFQ
ncbi:MAG: hypothetical protein LBR19_00380 [Bifidobacteriaceae bacterium]|jgi:hypothetical protein|nr:hypothetical protein [Bifidobacteriaceae bacterium]